MKYITYIAAILLLSCTPDHSKHDDIISRDLRNKQQELDILRELFIAQLHHDEESFKFYVSEYIRVPRLKLTEEQKQHPQYKEWLTDDIIKSGKFMSDVYNYE